MSAPSAASRFCIRQRKDCGTVCCVEYHAPAVRLVPQQNGQAVFSCFSRAKPGQGHAVQGIAVRPSTAASAAASRHGAAALPYDPRSRLRRLKAHTAEMGNPVAVCDFHPRNDMCGPIGSTHMRETERGPHFSLQRRGSTAHILVPDGIEMWSTRSSHAAHRRSVISLSHSREDSHTIVTQRRGVDKILAPSLFIGHKCLIRRDSQ